VVQKIIPWNGMRNKKKLMEWNGNGMKIDKTLNLSTCRPILTFMQIFKVKKKLSILVQFLEQIFANSVLFIVKINN
jgi:hypothetical protein